MLRIHRCDRCDRTSDALMGMSGYHHPDDPSVHLCRSCHTEVIESRR